MIIAEALDALITLGWAALAWLVFLSTIAAILILAAAATGAWTVRAVWRTARPAWARGPIRAWLTARRTRRDYEEAA
ncbi:hypothetical protein [Streptomyces sp. NPDC003299]